MAIDYGASDCNSRQAYIKVEYFLMFDHNTRGTTRIFSNPLEAYAMSESIHMPMYDFLSVLSALVSVLQRVLLPPNVWFVLQLLPNSSTSTRSQVLQPNTRLSL